MSALRTLPGIADFDMFREVFHCDKPGTGLKDAPQALSLKLKSITRQKCGLRGTSFDSELECLHRNGDLVLHVAIHVDDLKFAGAPDVIAWFIV